ncbi:MAG: nucleotidyltransferase family protein [Chloroflexi bacterium]|nr:nucleotidyltransferase family protein [Chloroflexota bacterium]
MKPVGLVPAAGFAERFGSDKLLVKVGERPMIEATVRSLLEGGVEKVVVVVPPLAEDIKSALTPVKGVTLVANDARERGMFSSIQAGAREADGDPILVLPGDQPWVEPATVAALLARYAEAEAIVSPRFNGKRGHPVVIPGKYRGEIVDAKEGATLHDILKTHAGERVDMDVYDRGVVRDVDVPGDLGEKAP